MKKILSVLSIIALAANLFFAQGASAAKPPEIKTVKGKIDSVVIGSNPMGGNVSEIDITTTDGQKMSFTVNSGIAVTIGSSDKVVKLRYLQKGDTVNISYITTKSGIKKPTAIEVFNKH